MHNGILLKRNVKWRWRCWGYCCCCCHVPGDNADAANVDDIRAARHRFVTRVHDSVLYGSRRAQASASTAFDNKVRGDSAFPIYFVELSW